MAADDPLPRFLQKTGWVLDIARCHDSSSANYEDLALPPAIWPTRATPG